MSVRTRETAGLPPDASLRRTRPAGRVIDRPGVQTLAALLLYLATSVLFFGIPVLRDIRHSYVGLGHRELGTGFTDPSVYMWSLVWWPHALTHGMNPLFTHLVWAPHGVHLGWTTTVPGASILAWPVTTWLGPVASYNVWMLVAPALAGWTAFILCRHVTGAFWPSIVGGYLFGFSSYELAQMTAHMNLSLIFPVPFAVLLVLLCLEGRLKRLPFVLLLAATVAIQFSFSTEILFTLTLFGGLIGILALALIPRVRAPLIRTAGWTALSYGVAAVVLGPLAFGLAGGSGFVPGTWSSRYSTDLLNLVVPTRISLLAPPSAGEIAGRFAAGLSEEGSYVGPLFLVVVLFAVRAIRTRPGQLLLASLGLIVLASLGPGLRVAGSERMPMPWALAGELPLVRMALPARFMLYAWLVVGLLAAVWLAAPSRRRWARGGKWALAVLCLVALLPNLTLSLWNARADTPAFFSDDLYRRYLKPGGNTLVIPFASNGFSMLWQAETDMSFPMTGGYIACAIPRDYRRWAIVATFLSSRRVPRYDVQLQAFLGHFDVSNIVVDPRARGPWGSVFGKVPVRPVEVGGVLFYGVPDGLLAQYRNRPRPLNVAWRSLQRSCQ